MVYARHILGVLLSPPSVSPGAAVVATMALVSVGATASSLWWWLSVSVLAVAMLLTMVNRVVLLVMIGWSLGRALVGIAVVCLVDGTSVGVGRLLCRDLAHLLDTISVFVGWLWPLWDPRRRTFVESPPLNTLVRRVEPDHLSGRHPAPRRARRVDRGAAMCRRRLAGRPGGLPARPGDPTKPVPPVLEQGPKIVTEMLTYDPKSLQKDLVRAQSLTTERYRPQLVAQQQAVQKGHPVVNGIG